MTTVFKDRRGVSLVEFALVLPFLVLLFIGGYQLSDAISAYRKVTLATKAIADLTSQYTSVSYDDLDTILNASTQVLAPYQISAGSAIVSQIYIDKNKNATIDWSRGLNATALGQTTPFTLPSSVLQPDTYVIVATFNYTYTPVTAAKLIGVIPMRDQIIMGPRASTEVKLRT